VKAKKFMALAVIAFYSVTAAFAQTWTPSLLSNEGCLAIASSADGNKLIALEDSYPAHYFISTNSGATWITNTEPQSFSGSEYGIWNCVALSADGSTVVAMNYNGVWSSTNFGGSWFSNNVPSVSFWNSVALSADGKKAVGVDGYSTAGGIYLSTNSGMTWSETFAPSNRWVSVTSSADGIRLAATAYWEDSKTPVPAYVSTNSGITWTPAGTPTNMECLAVASSADGSKLVVAGVDATAAVYGTGMIYTSTDFGNTWISNGVPSPPTGEYWDGVASSADGARLVAVSQGVCSIFTSTNSGVTWISNSLPSQLLWAAVASSADGTKLAAASVSYLTSGGGFTSQSTPPPQLNSTLTNSNLALSWLIPSTNFVLQQNSDLTTTNWSNVTNTPILNFTNLQFQVSLPAPVGNAFFRLKTP
jgi:hypothetical protein